MYSNEMILLFCYLSDCMLSLPDNKKRILHSAHVLWNVLNEWRRRDKRRGLIIINKFNNTRAQILDSIYHMTLRLL